MDVQNPRLLQMSVETHQSVSSLTYSAPKLYFQKNTQISDCRFWAKLAQGEQMQKDTIYAIVGDDADDGIWATTMGKVFMPLVSLGLFDNDMLMEAADRMAEKSGKTYRLIEYVAKT